MASSILTTRFPLPSIIDASQLPPATAVSPGSESAAHYSAVEAVLGLTATRLLFGGATGLVASSASLAWDDTAKAWAVGGAMSTTEVSRTGLTASTPFPSVIFNLSATKTWAAGALSAQADMLVYASTHAFASASTETNPATFAISGPPIVGANCTQVNPLAVHVRSGTVQVDGKVGIGSSQVFGLLEVGTESGTYTASMSAQVNVFGASSAWGNLFLCSTNAAGASVGGSIAFGAKNSLTAGSTSPYQTAYIIGGKEGGGASYNGYLAFSTTLASSAIAEAARFDSLQNFILGATVAGTTAQKCLALSNAATAPSASVDLCHLYSKDNGAGHATLSIYTEEVVAAVGIKLVTEYFPMFVNGAIKNFALVA